MKQRAIILSSFELEQFGEIENRKVLYNFKEEMKQKAIILPFFEMEQF